MIKAAGLTLSLAMTICGTTRATVSNEPHRIPVTIPVEQSDAATTPFPLQPSPYVPPVPQDAGPVLPVSGRIDLTFGTRLGAHASVQVLVNGTIDRQLPCERVNLYYAQHPVWFCRGHRVLAGEELRIRFDDMSEDFCPEIVDVGMMDRPTGLRLDAITGCSWRVAGEP